jgi:hypothetical protein
MKRHDFGDIFEDLTTRQSMSLVLLTLAHFYEYSNTKQMLNVGVYKITLIWTSTLRTKGLDKCLSKLIIKSYFSSNSKDKWEITLSRTTFFKLWIVLASKLAAIPNRKKSLAIFIVM